MIMSNRRKGGTWMGKRLPWAGRGYKIPRTERRGAAVTRAEVPGAGQRTPPWALLPKALVRRDRGDR
jgi:hypothetical protein